MRAVFFDIGDTLVCRPHVGPGRRIAEALALPPEAARVITRLVFHESFDSPAALAARLGGEFRLAAGAEAEIAAIWRAQEEEPVEVAGATDLVAAARAAGARVGVISNIWAPYAAGFRRACPAIVGLVESWHLSYQAGVAKPDPALFTAGLAALGVPAPEAVMVGDSLEKDIRPALALGMRALWVPVAAQLRDEVAAAVRPENKSGWPPEPPPADALVARDLTEARAIVLGLLGNAAAFGVSTAVP
jgi:HAD superfamily hydrolase (TIGR01509 family)